MSEVIKLKLRDEINEKFKWKVDKLYNNDNIWEEDFIKLQQLSSRITQFKGKLHEGKQLLEYLKNYIEISSLFEDLAVYAHLRSDEDTTNSKYQVIKEKIFSYGAELSALTSFFIPEILEITEAELQQLINEESGLMIYEFYLKQILEKKSHVLSEEEERILASVSDCLNAPGNIFNMLTNADMTFSVIKDEDGVEVELTEGNYTKFIRSKNREVRKTAFEALFNNYKNYKNTLSTAYTASVKNFIFKSKTRNYKSALESSLKPDKIPVEVYHNVINTVNRNINSLHKYVEVKKQLLGLDEMHMYDLYVPIIETADFNIEYEEGIRICQEALKPLGDEYLSIFNEGINAGWIDVYENKGKRGGAYSSGSYNSMPYVLLNYNNQINDVSTLAHEMGHSIHSYYSRKNQPYIYADYVLFCAEVASTTNECLLMDYLIKNEKDRNKRLYLINQQLEGIRTTVFRQTMFAEFELISHERIEKGEALSSEQMCKLYHELNVKYFGPTMIVDTEIDMEWSRIPHFYRDFYVYQYVTGFAAANSFSEIILKGHWNDIEKYKDFLKAGGSDYPINILKKAGVDMTTPKPLEDTINKFNQLLDLLQSEI